MVEGARLESVCGGNSTPGSNPGLSAIPPRAGARRSGDRTRRIARQETEELFLPGLLKRTQTQGGATETVKIDEKDAQKLSNGQQVVVQLKEDPRKAKDWQATQIKPMQGTM